MKTIGGAVSFLRGISVVDVDVMSPFPPSLFVASLVGFLGALKSRSD